MVFNSLQYAIFLPLVVAGYFVLPQRLRWAWLLAASYYFYMSWNPKLVVLILFTTAASYFAAQAMGPPGAGQERRRKAILALGVGSSLLCLFFFKYFNFFSENITALLRALSLPVGDFTLKVMLPVGISFYTFQTLSYVIDVYRGELEAEGHFGIYALYVSFFPQLVAGPIERATNLLPQFYEKHSFSTNRAGEGLRLVLWGLFKKVLVADTIAAYVNTVYNDIRGFSGLSIIAATLLFAVQIYCDFSGYSDIAIGSARILGFRLMENFRSPYFATSLQDFWRRWHISLSTWLGDYIFTPLVWSRWTSRIPFIGKHLAKPPKYASLMVTFLASGLWHGASWNFVIWGALHGAYQVIGGLLAKPRARLYGRLGVNTKAGWFHFGQSLVTFGLVCVSYIFFRANTLADSGYALSHLLQGLNPLRIMEYLGPLGMGTGDVLRTLFFVLLLFLFDWANKGGRGMARVEALPKLVRYACYYGLGFMLLWRIFTMPGDVAAEFIYFQF